VSTNEQGPVLIFGATGRHGGTGARVVERLRAAGRPLRAVVRTDDERAEQLRQSGVETMLGDLHDRRTLVPALEGVSSVYVAYPVAAGVALALSNVASVLYQLGASPHLVIMSQGSADINSPSGIAREHGLAEEMLERLGVNFTAVRGSALFYENVLLAHSGAIRESGAFSNCFGDSRPAWISGTDAADLCVSALLEPERYPESIVFPPGHERLSQQEIADIISEEIGREVRYEPISQEEWMRRLRIDAVNSGGLVTEAMITHLTAQARMLADGTTILRMDVDPAAIAAESGRAPLSFRNFVRQYRAAFGAVTAEA
jgi:uncharacterized protein YbjT (DUF2867 family)